MSMYSKDDYIDFFKNKKCIDNLNVFYAGELLERYKDYNLSEDKYKILEALYENSNSIKTQSIQSEQLNLFLSDFTDDKLSVHLQKKYIKYCFSEIENTKCKIEDSIFNLKVTHTEECLDLIHLICLFDDITKSIKILNSCSGIVNCLTGNRELSILKFYKYHYIVEFWNKLSHNQDDIKLLRKDIAKVFKAFSKLESKVAREQESKNYVFKNYKDYEILLINYYIGENLSLNLKEKIATEFILECCSGNDLITADTFKIMEKLYSKYFNYTRKKDDCKDIKEYLNRYFTHIHNIENYPRALNLIQDMLRIFYKINIDNPILQQIDDEFFMNIFAANIKSNNKDIVLKSISVLNSRKGIDYISEICNSKPKIYNTGYMETMSLIRQNIIDYRKLDYSADKFLNNYVIDFSKDLTNILAFDIFKFICKSYGVKTYYNENISYEKSIFSKASFLSQDQAREFFEIMCEYKFFCSDLQSFSNFIFDVFKIDKDFYLYEKVFWNDLLHKLKKEKLLSSSALDYMDTIFLPADELEHRRQKEVEDEIKHNEEYDLKEINNSKTINELYHNLLFSRSERFTESVWKAAYIKLDALLISIDYSIDVSDAVFCILSILYSYNIINVSYITDIITKIGERRKTQC